MTESIAEPVTAAAARILLITHATPPEGVTPVSLEPLRGLRAMLARRQPDPARGIMLPPHSRHLPHEVLLARTRGLPAGDDGIPWAAARAAELGLDRTQAWGFVSPCHWQAGADHLHMHHPSNLQLRTDEAHQLREAMAPWFESEGLRLLDDPDHPARWLACGEPLRQVITASPERASGRQLDRWMPDGPGGRLVRRLQSEMQMLLYQHPLHDERRARGLPPVNSFWLHGTGALPSSWQAGRAAPSDSIIQVDLLREPALAQDAEAWLDAWRRIDSEHLVPRAGTAEGDSLVLVLSGEHRSLHLATGVPGLWRRLQGLWRREASAADAHALLTSLGGVEAPVHPHSS